MYHTFYFFSRLSCSLNLLLKGSRILECFSQQKDELVFQFYLADGKTSFLKADLSQGSCLISFPSEFGRTRSNSTDLFPEITGSPITEVRQSPNDRSFHICFGNGLQICFKMYGNRSNVILHDQKKVLEVFNHHLKKDLEGEIPEGREIPENEQGYHPDPEILRSRFRTFSKRIWAYWENESKTMPLASLETRFNQILYALKEGPLFLCREGNEVFLSFFPIGEVLEESQDPIFISNKLYSYYWQVNRFFKQKDLLVAQWNQRIHQAKSQLEAIEKQWLLGEEARSYRLFADLLMAFGHLVPKGAQKVDLPDFEGKGTIEISLKKDLSVIENAERFYRKAKGQQQDLNRLEGKAKEWTARKEVLTSELELLSQVTQWSGLKPFIQTSATETAEPENTPYHLRKFMDYDIWVGKNAKANDEMLRLAHKDDLWLHARDVAGSHVIIRNKKGKTTPHPVIERAAGWAAYYSKGKSESLAPVMVTERKYVRKIKNTPAGQVRVEREKTILVKPEE